MSDDTIDLSDIKPVEFSWNETDMTTGFTAQEITAFPGVTATVNSIPSTITIGASSASSYTISTPWEELEERLIRLEKIIAEEEEVRRTHPAVNQAYNEYRLLYVLAKKNPGDLLTDQ